MASVYAPETAERLQNTKDSVAHVVEGLRTGGSQAETRVVESEIRTGILDAATEYKTDLIVLGEKGLRKFFLGSVSESVARHSQCSDCPHSFNRSALRKSGCAKMDPPSHKLNVRNSRTICFRLLQIESDPLPIDEDRSSIN